MSDKKKNSLSAIKTHSPELLKAVPSPNKTRPSETAPERAGEYKQPSKAGRKPKAAGQKEKNQVAVRFNDEEFAILQKNAGLVPLGTLLKHFIKENSDLLK